MKQFTNLKFRRRKILLALLLTLLVGVNSAWADELTIYESATSTSNEIPIYAYNADTNGDRSEFVVPSTMLTDISGKTITGITFYCANFSWGAKLPIYLVYMKEVASATLSAYSTETDATTVYTGELTLDGSQMTITFSTPYEYGGGNLLIGTKVTTTGSYVAKANSTFYGSTASDVTCSRYSGGNKYFIPKTTFTYESASVDGSSLTVKDGSTKLTSPYAYDFGLATAGTTHTFTLSNPGTAAVEGLSVSETGSFGASLSATSIAAGGEATLTITMPAATGSSAITISSTTEGIADFVINASGTIRDANKVYEYGFTSLPTDWTTTGTWYYSEDNGAYNTSWYLSNNARLITPKLTIAEGEVFYVEAKGYSTSNTSYQHLQMQYSADGTTWTNFDSEPSLDPSNWKTFSFTGVPVGKYYIAINASQADIRMFYGGQLPIEPKMVVTQPASLDYGIITEATAKTFTIANTGLATLEGITVTSSNSSIFTVSGAPTSLAAGASQEVTITMAATTAGALSSDIKVSATGMDDVDFTVSGVVMPAGMPVEDFAEGLPENWTNSSWTFADGVATGKSSSAYLTTPKLIFSDGDFIVIKAKRSDSDATDYITIQGSNDNGSTWTAYSKKISGSDGLTYPDYATLVVSDIPTTVNKLRFVGYYVNVDEIAGLTYAPVLTVTTGDPAETVSTPAAYDFGECAANASVTYNFANTGAGTINITGVAITGDGAAAYSTNWTESVAAPFALTITRAYDAARAGSGAQDAVVTVTTSDGVFVINVTGTDKAANAPELAVSTNAIDFGKQTADAVETVTVTNNGTGSMEVNIASDSEDFVVSAASLTEIGAGESKEFTVTFKYSTSYGVKNGNITVTPTYNTEAAQTITATAKAMDPETWTEDFAGNALPTGWEAGSNWSFSDGVAKAAYAYGSTTYLTTPKLEVSAETDELTFDYAATANYVSVKIQMSKDGADFADYHTISGLNNGDANSYTITGLEAGIYQFRFANDDYQLDNFEGFKLKAAAAHEAEVKAQTIPTTGNQYVEYTASIDVKVSGTNDETLTVKFFIGDTQYGESVVKTVNSNDTQTFEVTFTPDAAVSDDAYFTIESNDIAAFESSKVTVTIAAATVLDETVGLPDGLTTGTKPSVVVKYTAKDGWNTIAMPFALTDEILTEIFGAGYKIYEFENYSEGSISFKKSTSFYAGYPYLVYVETAATHADGVILKDVNISTTTANSDWRNPVTFQSTYAPIAAPNMEGKYGVTSAGKIQPGTAKASLKGLRAYFDLSAASAAQYKLVIDGETVVTGIDGITREAEEILNGSTIYNLKGQKVAVPVKGGLYIINGKKTILK